jgi:phytoene dehydrogenase-like protein
VGETAVDRPSRRAFAGSAERRYTRMAEYDVVIAGGGHNALACACLLTRHGVSTLVAERNAWIGGCNVTRELTLPGFKHDLFGSSMVWIHLNPTFKRELLPELERHGLEFVWSEDAITGHPNKYEGEGIVVYRDIDKTCDTIAEYSKRDARRYKEIYEEFGEIRDGVVKGMFSPPAPPSYMYQAMEKSVEGLRRLRDYLLSSRAFTLENFENDYVRAFILGWAMAPRTLPDQLGTAAGFYVMIPSIHYFGQAIPRGGSQALSDSMARYLRANGSRVLTDAPVDKFIVRDGTCRGIRLADGTEIEGRRAVVTALEPKQSFLRCVDEGLLPEDFLTMVRNYQFTTSTTTRVHYALHEAPRFRGHPDINRTAFQRMFGTMADIDRQYHELAAGLPPSDPFLWCACWTLLDPTRAPAGKHTLILDTFVPQRLASGESWEAIGKDFVDNVLLRQLRNYATNMDRDNIIAESIWTGPTLERANPCLVNGCTTHGARILSQMGYFRPFPGYAHYRSPIRNLYMAGPYCHPGGGLTAMGTITANVMLRDFGLKDPDEDF